MRFEWIGIFAAGCLLIGFGWRLSVVEARPLAYQAQFGVGDVEGREIAAFVAAVNTACSDGDVGALVGQLTPSYRIALASQLRHVGRELDAATLRAMVALVPAVSSDSFVVGRSQGNRVAVVVQQREVGFRVGVDEEFCLTCLRLSWDGAGFRLDRPELRHVGRSQVEATARGLVESWFSGIRPGKNAALSATDSWQQTSRK